MLAAKLRPHVPCQAEVRHAAEAKDALARFTIKFYSGKTLATPRSCPG